MPDDLRDQLDGHVAVARALERLLPEVHLVGDILIQALSRRNVLYTFGNGGSAADAQHLTGEIIGHYSRRRRPLAAVTLSTDPTTLTCIANDYDFADVFARQVEALVRPGDVVAAFTTSGRSPNIVSGLQRARAGGGITVLFGGGDGGAAREFADHALLVPSTSVPRIQEAHTFLLHVLAEMVDVWAADEKGAS
jgi:D-sedoheptulose 7-phosphate isomerase